MTEQPSSYHFPPALRWVLLATFFFSGAYLLFYWGTPLGLAPQLDAKENLAIAQQISLGELPAEAMYRAMLYPWLLSLFLNLGFPMTWMPVLASLFGILCHVAATILVTLLATRLWQTERAGLLAGILYGINPVAVYFAAIPFDITLSIVFFLAGLWFFTSVERPLRAALLGGTFLALAVLTRPHFFPVAIISPLIFYGIRGDWRRLQPAACAAWAPSIFALLLFGMINVALSGEFRTLPWQGAYNLYSANKAGADGRFHAQTLFLTEIEPHENPSRLESELLYRQTSQKEPPFSIDDMNAHWRQTTIQSVRQDFTGWLGLKLRKTYFLLNNTEQYNNLTYAYHKQNSPWLRFNPIGWGLLFLGAAGGFFIALLRKETWTFGLLIAGITYAAGVGLFFVSARFRLPLAPLLCILAAGGVHALPVIFKAGKPNRIFTLGAILAVCGAITFSRFFNVADTATFIQDESLIANAAAELGQDAVAYRYAARVLARQPDRPDAIRTAIISYFNLRLTGDPAWQEFGDWNRHRDRLERIKPDDPTLQLVAGVYRWQFGDQEEAVRLWQQSAASGSGAAQAILVVAGADTSRASATVHPEIREQLERVLRTEF